MFGLTQSEKILGYKIFLYILIFFIVLFLFPCLSSYLSAQYEDKDIVVAREELHDFDIGDIITVRYKTSFTFFTQAFTGMKYVHPIIICKKDKELYVFEMMNYEFDPSKNRNENECSKEPEENMFIIPLTKWLKINRNSHFMHHKLKGMSKKDKASLNDRILDYFEKNKHLKISGFQRFLNPFKKDIDEGRYEKNQTFLCYEVVGDFLVKEGIMNKNDIGKNFENIKLNKGLKYESNMLDLSILGYYF